MMNAPSSSARHTLTPTAFAISIHDFSPLLTDIEAAFRAVKLAGAPAVELIFGVKSRWRIPHMRQLSHQYQLPVIAVHQPMWSGSGVWWDLGWVAAAAALGARTGVLHPLIRTPLDHPRMQSYLSAFSKAQAQHNVHLCLENMPKHMTAGWFWQVVAPIEPSHARLPDLFAAATRYQMGLTYDTSHTMVQQPHHDPDFLAAFPHIHHIHLSSFVPDKEHLRLGQGNLDHQGFLQWLRAQQYAGTMTIELQDPALITLTAYPKEPVRQSYMEIQKIYQAEVI